MHRRFLLLLITPALLLSLGVSAAVAQAPEDGVRETIVTGAPKPPPLVQSSPGQPTALPCNLEGHLDDGADYLDPTGDLRTVMLFVDFSDAPGDPTTPQELFEGNVPQAEAALREVSHDRFRPTITPVLEWVRMPRSHAEYDLPARGIDYDNYYRFVREAIKAADPTVDFSPYSAVHVVGVPSVTLPTAAGPGYDPIRADGAKIANTTMHGSQDAYHRDFTVLVHEMAHLLGLPDLYPYKAGVAEYVGTWDMMAILRPHVPMTAWMRLKARWLRRSDFACARKSRTAVLEPVHSQGGLKALAVASGPRTAHVVEARTDPLGAPCRRDGVLVYRVNTRPKIQRGGGPVRVVDAAPEENSCGAHSHATFIPEGASSYNSRDGRFGVEVLGREQDRYRVRVTVKSCAVPDLFGLTRKEARGRLRAHQCALGNVTGNGKVRAQRPIPRKVKDPGTPVSLTLR